MTNSNSQIGMLKSGSPTESGYEALGEEPKEFAARHLPNNSTISLIGVFQILTGCCIFFACLRISVPWTVLATVVATPAIIRTGLASQLHLKNRRRFGWRRRIAYFVGSVLVVLAAMAIAILAFGATSVLIGLFCGLVVVVAGPVDSFSDAVILGIFGGTFWGFPAALIALGYCAKFWKPKLSLMN